MNTGYEVRKRVNARESIVIGTYPTHAAAEQARIEDAAAHRLRRPLDTLFYIFNPTWHECEDCGTAQGFVGYCDECNENQ